MSHMDCREKTKKYAEIMQDFAKMKRMAKYYYEHQNWEKALSSVFVASGFMYTMNLVQYDAELEHIVENIASANVKRDLCCTFDQSIILYYDGFGSVDRGLTNIYINGLLKTGLHIKYVTFEDSNLSKVRSLIGEENVFFIKGNTYIERMSSLEKIINKSRAGRAFLYMNPDDVVGVGTFSLYSGAIKRYMINLTDHAFWLGRNISDLVISFREFGCQVCESKRAISKEKIVYLPYYPCEISNEFKGFNFENSSRKVIFSGGALYKTISVDDKYYELVETILERFTEVNFVYLGNGDARKMKKLVHKYPDRVEFAAERSDFYEVMKRCTLYLSTYPYNGGLMTQYALLAKKVPVTLHFTGIDEELSVNHSENDWNFDTIQECVEEIDKLLNDEKYRQKKEAKLHDFLIDAQQFSEELNYILKHDKSKRSVADRRIEFDGFWKVPIENYTGFKYCRLFFRKNGLFMIRVFPVKYMLGFFNMIYDKSIQKKNKWRKRK